MDEVTALAVRACCFLPMVISTKFTLPILDPGFSEIISQFMVAMSKATFHSIATETSFTEFVAQLCLEREAAAVVAACSGVGEAHFFRML